MTPEQALAFLDEAASQVQANRAIHVRIQQALKVLHDAITEPPKEQTGS